MIIYDENEVFTPRPSDEELKVWERVYNVGILLDNAFRDWTAHAWNPKNGEPITAENLSRIASQIKGEVRLLRDLPGFTPTFRRVTALCEEAKGKPTKSEKELNRRADCLINAKESLDAYRLAFVAGQDNPDA